MTKKAPEVIASAQPTQAPFTKSHLQKSTPKVTVEPPVVPQVNPMTAQKTLFQVAPAMMMTKQMGTKFTNPHLQQLPEQQPVISFESPSYPHYRPTPPSTFISPHQNPSSQFQTGSFFPPIPTQPLVQTHSPSKYSLSINLYTTGKFTYFLRSISGSTSVFKS